ncbi:MAG: hypothetical protein LBJ00_17675 [Planctomycetaceae bacterium]|nr:hypothetical protein [Planctomycetaceae bacterium]
MKLIMQLQQREAVVPGQSLPPMLASVYSNVVFVIFFRGNFCYKILEVSNDIKNISCFKEHVLCCDYINICFIGVCSCGGSVFFECGSWQILCG